MSGNISLDSKIQEILKKYNLEEKQKTTLAQIQVEKNPDLIKKLCNEAPIQIITDTIFKLRKKTILPENVNSIVKSSFGFTDEITKKMAEDVIEAFKIDEQERLEIKREFEEEARAEEKLKKEIQVEKTLQERGAQPVREKNIISEKTGLEKPIVPPTPRKEIPTQSLESFGKDPYKETPSEEELKSKFYSL